jgi:hypothetical protein
MRQADVRRAARLAGTVLAGPVLAAAGCSSGPAGSAALAGTSAAPAGTVTGTYIRVGGPAGTPNVPLPGTVSFVTKSGTTVTLTADSHGKFTGPLPVGTYSVSATSSQVNRGASACSDSPTARVRAGKTVKILIVCNIR